MLIHIYHIKMNKFYIFFITMYFSLPVNAISQHRWAIDILMGDAFCVHSSLSVIQSGYADIRLTAKYRTNSFKQPFFYSLRFSNRNNDSGWELELIHLKIELVNRPPEIQRFEISHGYNLLTLNRIIKKKKLAYRIGCGIVFAHPENTIRGKSLSEQKGILNMGYYITGPTAQLSLEKSVSLHKKITFLFEGKLIASYSNVPISKGHAIVPVFSIHGLAGIRYSL